MKLVKFGINYQDKLIDKIAEIFDISAKEFLSFGIDYQNIDVILKEKFLDDGDFHPEWLNFLINLIAEIIKSDKNYESVILQREKSIKNKLKNIKFTTLTLRLDDFVDTGLKYIDYDLGFYIVWGIKNKNQSLITDFNGLLAPFADGQALICIANKDDNILKYIENNLINSPGKIDGL